MREVPLVWVFAETKALARQVEKVVGSDVVELEMTTGSSGLKGPTPRLCLVVAEDVTSEWFESVRRALSIRARWRRTMVVAEWTSENLRSVPTGALYPLGTLSQAGATFRDCLRREVEVESWEDAATARMLELLGVDDEVVEGLIRTAFTCDPPVPKVRRFARILLVGETTLRDRWARQKIPGSPKAIIDGIVALRLARRLDGGESLRAARSGLQLRPRTAGRLVKRVVGCLPSELTGEKVWSALEEWAG